jgi:hypothetical protein
MTNHPTTPSSELVVEAATEAIRQSGALDWVHSQPRGTAWCIAENAVIAGYAAGFCAGADQELDACCADILQILAGIFEDKVEDWNHFVQLLRDGRRPPPQERALDALLEERANFDNVANFELIKSVLERLLDD